MTDLRLSLKGDPLPWLLEPENPSIRYWTLMTLQGRLPCDLDVLTSRQALMAQPLVGEVFSRQNPAGHWGDASKPYTAEGSLGALRLLFMLGVEPDERTARGCGSFLSACQNDCGGFALVKKQRSAIFPCTTGEHLPMLVYFGLRDDERVRRAFAFVIDSALADNPLRCSRYQHRDCLWGAIAVLNGLAVLPDEMRAERPAQAVHSMAEALLSAPYDFSGEHKRWLTFGVPRGWDLLSALLALAAHGYGHDPRFERLLELVLDRQVDGGRWLCGSVSRTWSLERRGQPSKWVTLDALRLIKALQ